MTYFRFQTRGKNRPRDRLWTGLITTHTQYCMFMFSQFLPLACWFDSEIYSGVNSPNRFGGLTGILLKLARGCPFCASLGKEIARMQTNVTGSMRLGMRKLLLRMKDTLTFPTHANNCRFRGESSVLSHNSELSSELRANRNCPERRGENRRSRDWLRGR